MSRIIRRTGLVFSAAVIIGLSVSVLVAQEKKPEAGGMSAEQAAQMEAWAKLAAPGPQHEAMKAMAGKFNAEVTMTMAPGAPPEVSKGVSTNELILGGRFLQSKFEGTFMGQPFTGLGFSGYDNLKKKHTSVWMDSMGTMVMVSEGSADASGKVITFKGTMPDPTGGKEQPFRQVVTHVDENKHTFDMYSLGPDGKDFKCMSIVYTRAK